MSEKDGKDEKSFEEKWGEELQRIVEESRPSFTTPDEEKEDNDEEDEEEMFASREYKAFKEEERKHTEKSLYEKLCNIAEEIIVVEPSEEKKEELQRSIDMAYMQITPEGAYSFAILSGMSIFLATLVIMLMGVFDFIAITVMILLGMITIYLLSEYPNSQARLFRVKAADQIMLAIIYMVIYMRTSPNLEGAIKFTADHLGEPLSLDLKKLLWDVETRNYISMRAALADYLEKWKDNKPFVEAIQILENSMEQSDEKRKAMLDEAINTMMTGTRETMKRYSNKLELPIMVIHALGIMLPIMVLVMFPIILLMMEDSVRPIFLVIGYNIMLPLIIYLTGKRTLEYRPMGFSEPNISRHPDHIESGKVRILGKDVRILPISLLVSIPMVVVGAYMTHFVAGNDLTMQIMTSLLITFGVAIGPSTYFLLDSHSKLSIRKKVRDIEEEFSDALFSLGNRLGLGEPVEKAAEDTVKKNEELEITDMFEKAVENMRKGGMNLRNAFFDKKFGAVWHYPSKLITSVMKIVVDAAEKGSEIASKSAISISRYLEQLQQIEEDMKDMLSSETTSMKFLGTFLGPFVAGVSVGMAAIMISIFEGIGRSMEELGAARGGGMAGVGGMGLENMLIGGWGITEEVMPVSWIQVVVGIYVVQVCYLLAMLTTGVENGPGDKIATRRAAGTMILIGSVVYALSLIVVWQVFGGQIAGLLGRSV